MARMSIDDSFGRDARVRRLAKSCGWSRRETMGALFDIFALCYDRVSEFLPEADIITTAEADGMDCPGFVEKMIAVGLASRYRAGMIRIAGAEERIKYLRRQSALGRTGGLKSAESRRKTPKGKARVGQGYGEAQASLTLEGQKTDPQGPANPPDPVPDPASDPDPVPALAPSPDPRARLHLVPDDPRGLEVGRLLRVLLPLHVEIFNTMRTELELEGETRPMHVIGDPSERALHERLSAAVTLEGFEEDARHVLAIRQAEARKKRTLRFLGVSVWGESFDWARSMSRARDVERVDPKASDAHDHFGAMRETLAGMRTKEEDA